MSTPSVDNWDSTAVIEFRLEVRGRPNWEVCGRHWNGAEPKGSVLIESASYASREAFDAAARTLFVKYPVPNGWQWFFINKDKQDNTRGENNE